MTSQADIILDVRHLSKHYPIERGLFRKVVGTVKAVDDVSLVLHRGETLGLVGESGCGKTTLGRCIVRAIEPSQGQILLCVDGQPPVDLALLDRKTIRPYRRYINMVFQDPYSSLDPRMTVLDIVGEPLRENGLAQGPDLEERVKRVVQQVGLDVRYLKRYPHAFSGGQRQRIGIARALATEPQLIVADEPVTALDVSIRAQILNLLQDIQAQMNLAFLFIAHDLSVVQHISDRVAVMYLGRIVESGATQDLFTQPAHPYTEALLSALPIPDPDVKRRRLVLPGEIANPAKPPTGCPFHPRCRYVQKRCMEERPAWVEKANGRGIACHRADELSLTGIAHHGMP